MQSTLRSFGKYVPLEILRSLLRNEGEAILGVEPVEVSIYFSDIG